MFGACSLRADSISNFTDQISNHVVVTSGEPSATGSQIQTYLRDNGGTSVTFHFENLGSFADSVTEVYFQDGSWLTPPPGIARSNPGVSWVLGANPNHLPGANSVFTADILLNSNLHQGTLTV